MWQETFEEALAKSRQYGEVKQTLNTLVIVDGLPGARLEELVVFEAGQLGYVLALGREHVEIVNLSEEQVIAGNKVSLTNRQLSVPVSNGLRGQVIDPLGRPLSNRIDQTFTQESRNLDIRPPDISLRRKIRKPLRTGASLIDLLLPLGYGQREVILGEQKTGKTALAISTLGLLASQDIVIYAPIGKPLSALAEARAQIELIQHHDNVIVVATSAADPPSLISLTPFTAMTVAEYFRDLGHNVVLVLDDLTTHARFWREISLLAKRFPGRESYPGDIFHLHARLLERAGNFVLKNGQEAAITCLPIAETVGSDLTSYIVSNLISITDGHLLFDAKLFNQGQRPSIDTQLSVTRVGRQTQDKLGKELHRRLTQVLNQHQRVTSYAHFGAELGAEAAQTLDIGNKLNVFLSQPPYLTIPWPVQVVMAAIILNGWLSGQMDEISGQWRDRLVQQYNSSRSARQLLDSLLKVGSWEEISHLLEAHQATLLKLCQYETLQDTK